MDARFVLVELGKLSSQMEYNTKAFDVLGGKVDAVISKVNLAQTTLVVFGAIMTPLLVGA